MRLLKLPTNTSIPFMRWRWPAMIGAGGLCLLSLLLFLFVGLNYGIDFKGGTLVEVRVKQLPVDIGAIRSEIGALNLGDVQIQEIGDDGDVLIRVERQDGGEEAQQRANLLIQETLGDAVEVRRVEVVGPRVSDELARAGLIGVIASLVAILAYIWLRFEWHFAVGAVVTTLHDVLLTIGLYAVLRLDFTLASIAAILTIVGYSLNDTVVVYDRVRENLRRYKKMPLPELLDLSINQTLSRTIMTSATTLLALFALFVFGGEVIRQFVLAMIFGIMVGTFSSVFIASPLLVLLKLRPERIQLGPDEPDAADATEETAAVPDRPGKASPRPAE